MQIQDRAPAFHLGRGDPFARDAIHVHRLILQLNQGLEYSCIIIQLSALLLQFELHAWLGYEVLDP
jgi:hypothetical protein